MTDSNNKHADISELAVQLGRAVDRLPDGVYTINLVKTRSTWSLETKRNISVERHTFSKMRRQKMLQDALTPNPKT